MLRHYLNTAFKYFKKNIAFSAINVAGLTLGLTVSFFALLYVKFENSYDSYHKNVEHIYRVVTDVKSSTGIDYRGSAVPLAPALQSTFPEVKTSTRIVLDYLIVQNEGGPASQEKIAFADTSLFSVFSFPLIRGDTKKSLAAPFNIVLSKSCAKKYFGDTDPVGKTLLINGRDQAYVTSVMKDIPYNSHFNVDMLVSISTLLEVWDPELATRWISSKASTYVLLYDDANVLSLQKKLPAFVADHYDQNEFQYSLILEPLKDVYLHGKARGSRSGSSITGDPDSIYILCVIAGFVLLIACCNFIGLTTAFSLQRSKEIGVRKCLGATRGRLILQFLSEALLLSLGAWVCSIFLVTLLTPFFHRISGRMIDSIVSGNLMNIGWFILISIVVGLLSGIYPALYISGIKPVNSLKGNPVDSSSGLGLRRALVLSQFAISTILVLSTLVVFHQLYFMRTQELGFKKDHNITIDFQFNKEVKEHLETLKALLATVPGVSDISSSSCVPGRSNHKLDTELQNIIGENQVSRLDAYFVDDNFFHQYQIDLVAGRQFSNKVASDSTEAMIVNEAAVRWLGFHRNEEAIGRKFTQWGRKGQIIGVVRDFHFQSFRKEVQPLTFQMGNLETLISITIQDTHVETTVNDIETKWNQIAGGIPLIYFFSDDAYDSQYLPEKRFGHLFLIFAGLAIVLSCLGLVGLTVFSTAHRTKEIGIRKILGSSRSQLLVLLSKEFLVLIAVALVIAFPGSWYAMDRWLSGFAYRIDISWWTFAITAGTVLLAGFASIAWQTVRAASVNPIQSLRDE